MRAKPFFILIFSVLSLLSNAQKAKSDTIKTKKYHYEPVFLVGFDLLSAGIGMFSDRKLFQGFASTQISEKVHLMADLGFEKNTYDKSGYDAKVSGFFAKAGGVYMMVEDPENKYNGFYLGPKIGASFYSQEYYKVPVKGYESGDYYVSFPSSSQSSYWLEAVAGGRVQLFQSNFFIDVQVQPRYLVFTTKQEHIKPMIVPGFGKSSADFNMGFSWNIVYKF